MRSPLFLPVVVRMYFGQPVLVLQPAHEVGEFLVALIHAEVVVGEAQRGGGRHALHQVQQVGLHVLDRVRVDAAVRGDARVAEGARERAAAGDLEDREVAGLVERIQPPMHVGRGDLVEVRDAGHGGAFDELLRAGVDPGVAGQVALEHAIELAADGDVALDQVLEGPLALVGRAVDVAVDGGLRAQELFLHGFGERPVRAAEHGERLFRSGLGVLREVVRQPFVPGVAREAHDVGRFSVDGLLEVLGLAEDLDPQRGGGDMGRREGGDVGHPERVDIRAARQDVVAEVGQVDRHGALHANILLHCRAVSEWSRDSTRQESFRPKRPPSPDRPVIRGCYRDPAVA